MRKYWHALWKAACAESGMTMLGSEMPLVALPQSRYALIAMRIDSVPPDVKAPQLPGGPLYILSTIATTCGREAVAEEPASGVVVSRRSR